ncbi:hypothetical protein Bca52824_034623 [Brassica carinata]|uniref:Ubiquitin-like protease family profile domain-containing protein n=1 Tax=Brassica carinata TaxID=52824 RepID=A0A8X7S259_BRACI|nr:hypothetical protein Bca52824_034623 [Brassica carinata]
MPTKVVKTAVKDRLKLKLFDDVFSTPSASTAERIYFPFNIDQTHWVAVCIDMKCSSIHLLDCNVSLNTDSMMKNSLARFRIIGVSSPFSVVGFTCEVVEFLSQIPDYWCFLRNPLTLSVHLRL